MLLDTRIKGKTITVWLSTGASAVFKGRIRVISDCEVGVANETTVATALSHHAMISAETERMTVVYKGTVYDIARDSFTVKENNNADHNNRSGEASCQNPR